MRLSDSLFRLERGARVAALYEHWCEGDFCPEHFWPAVGDVWTDTEMPSDWDCEWREMLGDDAWYPGRSEGLMTEEERATLAALPGLVNVYRGVTTAGGEGGLSWTLDRKIAERFARRFPHLGDPVLVSAQVPRERIIALFNGRNESEVLILDLVGIALCVDALEKEAPR